MIIHLFILLSAVQTYEFSYIQFHGMFIQYLHPTETFPHFQVLGDRTDFSKKESLTVIERFLVSCSEKAAQRLQA